MTEQPEIGREQLAAYLLDLLKANLMQDYCPNGLQVEGKPVIRRIITGVTASKTLIERAIEQQADAVLVHHGLFWKGDPTVLGGFRLARLKKVLANDLNVFAYHLPLDTHPQLGNNVQLGLQMGWELERTVGDKGLVCLGKAPHINTVADLVKNIELNLGRKPQVIGNLATPVKSVAWCTGGAPGYVELASQHGASVYVTGEMSEPAAHIALETGTVLIGAGHHATERGGVMALGKHLTEQFGIDVQFIDCFVDV